jgi:cystathionine beta-lyase family protein involved in aluminum resistance
MAPAIVSEGLKGASFLQRALLQFGWTPHVSGAILVPQTHVALPSEAAVRALLAAVQENACLHAEAAPRTSMVEGEVVLCAGADFVSGSGAEPHVFARLQPPFDVVMSGGTHWTQWATILADMMDRMPSTDHA